MRKHDLSTRTARRKLAVREAVYWVRVRKGRGLGYRRSGKTTPGVWYLRWRLDGRPTGSKYKWESFGTADDLAGLVADGVNVLSYDQAFDLAGHFDPDADAEHPAEAVTVNHLCDAYIEATEPDRTEHAAKEARYTINRHIRPSLGDIKVSMLTTQRIRQWRNDIAASPAHIRSGKDGDQRFKDEAKTDDAKRARKATANRILSKLKAVLNFGFNEGLVACSDAAWRRAKPFKSVEKARQRYLDKAEAKRLLNATSGDFQALVTLALHTGCRYAELARLRVEDVHLEAHSATIRQSKSGKPRTIFLDVNAYRWLETLMVGKPGDYLVLMNGSIPWRKSAQQYRMREACEDAKIERITFHGLRHTFASHYVMNGGHLIDLAKQLGHADTRMCERHYAHLSNKYLQERIQAHAPTYGVEVPVNVTSIDRVKKA